MSVRVIAAAGVVAGVFVGGAVPAPAATVSSGFQRSFVFEAAAGEPNSVTVTVADGRLRVVDTGALLVAGQGCVSLGPNTADCSYPDCWMVDCFMEYRLRDLADSLSVRGPFAKPHVVELGAGDDHADLRILNSHARVSGGSGDDRVLGGEENDSLSGGPGADFLKGRGGSDEVSYRDRLRSVHVTVDGRANDGERDEGDNVQAEAVIGGRGDDVLVANEVNNEIRGGGGNDRVECGAANDRVFEVPLAAAGLDCERVYFNAWVEIQILEPEALSARGGVVPVRLEVQQSPPQQMREVVVLETQSGTRLGRGATLAESGPSIVKVRLNRRGRRLVRRTDAMRIRATATVILAPKSQALFRTPARIS